jgi:diaminopimelate epimerase
MIPFSKYQGAGNDFILIDNRKKIFPTEKFSSISKLCERKWGIGADGLILLENSTSADFRMRIFNSDGKEAESCGNGLRCLMKFLIDLGLAPKPYKIELMNGQVVVAVKGDMPVVYLDDPQNLQLSVHLKDLSQTVHLVDTGVPHGVVFTQQVEKTRVAEMGRILRNHPAFSPKGINVNFAQVMQDRVKVRVYERGVEDETLACGTGAAAVALIAHELHDLPSPISLEFPGGMLEVSFEKEKGRYKNIQLIGSAELVFIGSFKE